MKGSPVEWLVNRLEPLKIAPSQATLHLPADRENSHEGGVTCVPAGWLVLRPARQLENQSSFAWRASPRTATRARRGCAQAFPRAAAGRPLSGRLRRHLIVAKMAALFAVSVSKSPSFAGRLRRACAYYSCHILYLAVFLDRLYGNMVFKGSKF